MIYFLLSNGISSFFLAIARALSNGLRSLKTVVSVAMLARNPWEFLKVALPARLQGQRILNEGREQPWESHKAPEARAVAQQLRQLCNQLKAQAYMSDGGVDYARLGDSELFEELVKVSQSLGQLDPDQLRRREEKLSFWINLYNILMIHGVIALGLRRSVMEVPSFFTTLGYQVGDYFLSPDDIEHGLLRGNAGHPVTNRKPFADDDPRRQWELTQVDPRIHFALVCVARSCPPIAFYDPHEIDHQLEMASANFIEDQIAVDDEGREIILSEIFNFYESDFGGRQGLIDFIVARLQGPSRDAFETAVEEEYRWRYQTYDWSLNSL